jgi:fructose-specific phosphotransferase system IIC component
MVIAASLTPLLVLGSIAAVIILAPEEVVIGFLVAVTVGLVAGVTAATLIRRSKPRRRSDLLIADPRRGGLGGLRLL